jgi:hypothetical protein
VRALDEDLAIFIADFCDFLDTLEEAVQKMKQQIAKLVGVQPKWDPNKIKWEDAEGSSGQYQRSEDFNNPEFKAMLKDLQAHNGKLTRNGYFYWIFKNGSTVGRKRR